MSTWKTVYVRVQFHYSRFSNCYDTWMQNVCPVALSSPQSRWLESAYMEMRLPDETTKTSDDIHPYHVLMDPLEEVPIETIYLRY